MIVLVLGATPAAIARLRRTAAARGGMQVVDHPGSTRPDWVITATAGQRAAAIRQYRLPAYRVIEDLGVSDDRPRQAEAWDEAMARMAGIGRHAGLTSPLGVALGARAGSSLLKWMAGVASGTASPPAASTGGATTAAPPPPPARLLALLRREDVRVLTTLLAWFLKHGYLIHVVVVGEDTPQDLSLSSAGLTVGPAPEPSGIGALFADQRPDLLLLTPARKMRDPQHIYIQAARAAGIRTLMVPTRWDDLPDRAKWREVPDCIAVWNTAQRRGLVERGVPSRAVALIGAPLSASALPGKKDKKDKKELTREQYCASVGIEPNRRIILWIETERPSILPAQVAIFQRWHAALRTSADPLLREAAVIIHSHHKKGSILWDEVSEPGAVVVEGAHSNRERTRLILLMTARHADAIVACDAQFLLEAAAGALPVVGLVLDDMGEDAEELRRFCSVAAGRWAWPPAAASIDAHLEQLSQVLRQGLAERQRAIMPMLRPHGPDLDPAELIAAHLARGIRLRPAQKAHREVPLVEGRQAISQP